MGRLTDEQPLTGMISNHECEKLILNHLTLKGEEGASEEEITKVISWAESVRLDNTLLDMALDGELIVGLRDNEVVFRKPTDEQKKTFKSLVGETQCPQS